MAMCILVYFKLLHFPYYTSVYALKKTSHFLDCYFHLMTYRGKWPGLEAGVDSKEEDAAKRPFRAHPVNLNLKWLYSFPLLSTTVHFGVIVLYNLLQYMSGFFSSKTMYLNNNVQFAHNRCPHFIFKVRNKDQSWLFFFAQYLSPHGGTFPV